MNNFLVEVYDAYDISHDMKTAIRQIKRGENPKLYPTEDYS